MNYRRYFIRRTTGHYNLNSQANGQPRIILNNVISMPAEIDGIDDHGTYHFEQIIGSRFECIENGNIYILQGEKRNYEMKFIRSASKSKVRNISSDSVSSIPSSTHSLSAVA